jgi:ABC-type sugar transport system permease subunit
MADTRTGQEPPKQRLRDRRDFADFGRGFWVRLIGLGILDAVAIYSFFVLLRNGAYGLLASLTIGTLFINWVYLTPWTRALRWLTPGLIMMAAFVVFPIIYTMYVSVTNWSTGNILQKSQVIERIESRTFTDPDAQGRLFDLYVYRDDATGDIRLYLTDEGAEVIFGNPRLRTEEPVEDALEDPEELGVGPPNEDGIPTTIGPYRLLSGPELFSFAINNNVENLVLDIPDGAVTVLGVNQGRVVQASQQYRYDAARDVMVDLVNDKECRPGNEDIYNDLVDRGLVNPDAIAAVDLAGDFVCDDGEILEPGWVKIIGFDNFTRIATNSRIRAPFVGVFIWNVVFALGSVFFSFAIGLILALTMQHERVRGKLFYRSVLILPYAIPAFLSILVWRGLLNEQFGQVNDLFEPLYNLFNIDPIPWLSNGTWAKAAILLVNTWLGFPYMFLLTTGALQSIPTELQEAARTDGASGIQVFRKITFPLLMVSLAPLLIGSFAFNFNNFILIFMLTNGGPPILDAAVPVGETDILISFTFDVAVQSGRGANFGLGSAITIFIFLLVAAISAFSFRFTKRLEEIYGTL